MLTLMQSTIPWRMQKTFQTGVILFQYEPTKQQQK